MSLKESRADNEDISIPPTRNVLIPLQARAAYHLGFDDARDGEPLYEGGDPDYRAGWLAYHDCVRLFSLICAD